MTAKQWLLLVILASFWGTSFALQKVAIAGYPPVTIAAVRILIAGLFLWVALRLTKGPLLSRGWKDTGQSSANDIGKSLMPYVILGVANMVGPYFLIAWAQFYIPSSVSGILLAAVPLFTILLAHFFTSDEKLIGRRLLGVTIGIGGVVLLIGPEALLQLGDNVVAQLGVVLAGFGYAITNVYGRRYRHFDPERLAAGSTIAAAILMVPVALIIDQPWLLEITLEPTIALVLTGLTGTGMPTFLFYHLLRQVGPTNISLVAFLVPVFAVLTGMLFLGESLAWNAMAAFGVILIALAIVNPPKRLFGALKP